MQIPNVDDIYKIKKNNRKKVIIAAALLIIKNHVIALCGIYIFFI